MENKLIEAIQKGISNGLNFEIGNEKDNFNIKKSFKKTTYGEQYVAEQLQKAIRDDDHYLIIKICSLEEYKKMFPNAFKWKPQTKEELKRFLKNFSKCPISNDKFDLNWIDTSDITDMSHLFDLYEGTDTVPWEDKSYYNKFNYDISKWDVSNVTDMNHMFYCCTKFNNRLGKWDVSNVKDMSFMFFGCFRFNKYIDEWDVSNVKNMEYMFSNIDEDVSIEDYMDFNQDISEWDVSNVENMEGLFYGPGSFKIDLKRWKVDSLVFDPEEICNYRWRIGNDKLPSKIKLEE